MADVTTSEIQNRITGLKAELDRLSFQLEAEQRGASAPEKPESPVAGTEARRDAVGPVERERSVRTLRDLMWQGRWGLAFHLARALETQGGGESDFRSSAIRTWALAHDGRRLEADSLRLAEELRSGVESMTSAPLAPRVLDWATRIGVASGVDGSQVGMLADGFSPPTELSATSEWWRRYVEALRAAPKTAGKWVALPDPQQAVCEVEELMLRGDLEPVRLAASCLMMSIRRAMRHVHVLSRAEERFILNGELAGATTLEFTANGEVASEAGVVERAVCDLASLASRKQTVVISEFVQPFKPGVDEAAAGKSATNMPALQTRQSAARDRLERYAERLRVHESVRLAAPQDQPVAARADGSNATRLEVNAAQAVVLPFAAPTNRIEERLAAGPLESNDRKRAELPDPVAGAERDDRRGIHEAALASAFGADGQRAVSSNARVVDGTTLWAILFNPQAAIVAALLVIAGAVIVGLGTGLAAKDIVESTTPADEGVEAPAEFAGDFPAVD
jgi:hypothetical protein